MTMESLYEGILNKLADGIYYVDHHRDILVWNSAAERITGYSAAEVLNGGKAVSFLDHIDKDGNRLSLSGLFVDRALGKGETCEQEMLIKHKKGYRVPVMMRTMPVYGESGIAGALEIFSDKLPHVEKNETVDSLTRIGMVDHLTGLANRRQSETVLEAKLRAFKQTNKMFCVLLVNVDNFAACNDTYGYESGNEVLMQVADSLRCAVRRADFVGRWQSDEFIGIFEVKEVGNVRRIAEKLRVLVEDTPHMVAGKAVQLTVSIGGAAVRSGDTSATLLQRADEFTRKCKQSGKNLVATD